MKICKNCGQRVEEEKTICSYCGKKFIQKESTLIKEKVEEDSEPIFGLHKNKYNKWISMTLCLLLGWLGAHKFYERKYVLGFLYLFTYGFFGIGPLIDFFILLKKTNPYYLYQ